MAVAGRVLMIPAGNWTSGTAYGMLDVVIYSGSSYVAKKNISNSTVIPPNDASNWQLLAQGFDVTNTVTKSMIVNNFLATDPETVLSGPMGKSLKEQLDEQNSNLANKADASALNSKLSNDNPDHLTSIGFDTTKAVLKAGIDGIVYPIPINIFGDNRMVKGIGIYYDSAKGKNVMQVNWWADGVDHTNYISFD